MSKRKHGTRSKTTMRQEAVLPVYHLSHTEITVIRAIAEGLKIFAERLLKICGG